MRRLRMSHFQVRSREFGGATAFPTVRSNSAPESAEAARLAAMALQRTLTHLCQVAEDHSPRGEIAGLKANPIERLKSFDCRIGGLIHFGEAKFP